MAKADRGLSDRLAVVEEVQAQLVRLLQSCGLLVQVADLRGVRAEGVGQERTDGFEFGQRLIWVAVGGQQLRDDESGLKNLPASSPLADGSAFCT